MKRRILIISQGPPPAIGLERFYETAFSALGYEAHMAGIIGELVDPGDSDDIKRKLLELLEKNERSVPDGLAYFTFVNFEKRLHRIISKLI